VVVAVHRAMAQGTDATTGWLCSGANGGNPQGGVISPLLANIFMHHAFDDWMRRHYSAVPFERYADDAIIHCVSEAQATHVLEAIRQRLGQCGLELHPMKTKIVYCKDDDRRGEYERVAFDFLGYTFQPRRARNRWGKHFVSFLPAISNKAAKRIWATVRGWRMAATRNNQSLEALAEPDRPVCARLDELLRSILSITVRPGSQTPERRLGALGVSEIQAVSTPRARCSPLVGSHRAAGPQIVRPVETRHQTGGWAVGAG
jgi:hypothetical protein